MKLRLRVLLIGAVSICLFLLVTPAPGQASNKSDSNYFGETGHAVVGEFLTYWVSHGGLMRFGYPISDEAHYPTGYGWDYAVQYFERAMFRRDLRPDTPTAVQLDTPGASAYLDRYGCAGGPGQPANKDNEMTVPNGLSLGGRFRKYLEQDGGVDAFGLPVSNEFQETSPLDGMTYTVQYFEQAEFEYHPENSGSAFEVLLSHLGVSAYQEALLTDPAPIEVWEDNTHSCATCERDILGKYPESGQVFPIATGPVDQVSPIAFRRKVAWIEATDSGKYLAVKDLDTSEVKTVADPDRTAGALRLSNEYLVWVDENYHTGSKVPLPPNGLYAYNLSSGQVIQVTTYFGRPMWDEPVVALAGHILAWSQADGIKARDLNTGVSWDISQDSSTNVEVTGNRVTWFLDADHYWAYELDKDILLRMPPCH